VRLKLTLSSGQQYDDILVTVDATAPVGSLAERLRVGHPSVRSPVPPGPTLTLTVSGSGTPARTLDPRTPLGEAGLRSGDVVELASDDSQRTATAAAHLKVVAGRNTTASFPIASGTSFVGRDRSCSVRLDDPLVSKRHLRLNVSDVVEVVDENSANGVMVNGERVQRAVLRSSDRVTIGDTTFVIDVQAQRAVLPGVTATQASHAVDFNRSPRLDPTYPGVELVAPEPPARTQPQRFPFIPLIAPVLMAGIMFAVTRNALSILFVALSPLMLVGSFLETRMSGKKAFAEATEQFRASLRDLAVQLQYAGDQERQWRRAEHPALAEVVEATRTRSPLLWTRRPEHDRFLQLRLGLGTQPSRNSVKLPMTNNTTPELWRELNAVAGQYANVDRVPVVASLRECGGVGVAGHLASSSPLVQGLVAQLAGLHSPSEVVVAALASPSSMGRWDWLKWLPHVNSEHSPLPVEHLASGASGAIALISSLEDLIASRVEQRSSNSDSALPLPVIVMLVEDDAAEERARLVTIAETGPSVGVFTIWSASRIEQVPAACRTFLEVDPNHGVGRAGFVDGGVGYAPVEVEALTPNDAARLARDLSPLVDSGALLEDQSDLPRQVSFLSIGGLELATQTDDVVERWRGTNSLPPEPGAPRLKRDNSLRALVGQSATDRFYLDLRTQGPHALVGGTTGAGKSEFLQSWILGMAVAHSPARVNFLFVDYKGGAAFADCVDLPHNVGLVTDLSPHLVRRALRSLNAELRRREHLFNRKKAKDLLELERRRDPECPPSLVIVVDEFAALVSEVPEFVDGVVNVAQRGRSLGLHLILATQRPAGVIRDNLRANTNLRVALRMADEADSDDVVGSTLAAGFDPSLPGRGVAKTGPGRLTSFQTGYVGGFTSSTPPPPPIDVTELRFGSGTVWEVPESVTALLEQPAVGPNDIRKVVDNVAAAAFAVALPKPRRPWLPDLPSTYRLEDLPSRRTDDELVFGVIDRPDDQEQPVVAFHPDRDGNMAVYGTGGSGKSALLRSLAIAAGFAPARGGPCLVYALDFGSRGLQMLEPLPHVGAVIPAEDVERTIRLLKMLRAMIDERAERYAKANASTIAEYRARAGRIDEARLLVLVDNFGAFRQAYELGQLGKWFETFVAIAADGRSVGVHVVVSADRPATIPSSLNSAIQRRLVLRLASEIDYAMLNTPDDVLTSASPPGRGYMDDSEVQAGIFSGDPNVAVQSAKIASLVQSMRRAGVVEAPPIARLPEVVRRSEVPAAVGGQPVLGVWDETLQPIGFEPVGSFVVTGPPQSGKSTTVASMVVSLRNWEARTPFVLFGGRRSAVVDTTEWMHAALDPDEMEPLALSLTERLGSDDPALAGLVVVIESIGDLLNGPADMALQDLLKACRTTDRFVIAEGETSAIGSSWPLLQAVRVSRYGIAMQPEQLDGDSIFKTSFPRTTRSEYPQGRGLFVRAGRVARVQVPLTT
jgi:S-DNA-T family DNA segregation ATPase FtsK/SpoIIIE